MKVTRSTILNNAVAHCLAQFHTCLQVSVYEHNKCFALAVRKGEHTSMSEVYNMRAKAYAWQSRAHFFAARLAP